MVPLKMKWMRFHSLLLACVVILAATVLISYLQHISKKIGEPRSKEDKISKTIGDPCSKEDKICRGASKQAIVMLAKVIHNAKKHVRGSKTSDYLLEALFIMNDILKDMKIDKEGLYVRSSTKSTHICPEHFMGVRFGFPLYYNGFERDHCVNSGVLISNLLTIIKYIDFRKKDLKASSKKMQQFLTSIHDTKYNISTFIAIDSDNNIKSKYPLGYVFQSKYQSEGFALNTLVQKVKTPFILVARNIDIITNDSRLERLVGEIESLNVVAAGGSFRYPDGHWKRGCFQSVYRNYTLKYAEGYDESFHECIFCDYVQGPFVTTTKYLKQNTFLDWFLRVFQKGNEAVVCPDSMFHADGQVKFLPDANLNGFMQKWDLFTTVTPQGYTVTRGCENQAIQRRASLASSPCDLQLNIETVTLIMRTCEDIGVICELQEGTALGAVKMGKTLPWELDFDIRFLLTNCPKCRNIERAFNSAGFEFDRSFVSPCCEQKLKLGEEINFGLRHHGYTGDFTGHPVMDSDLLLKAGLAPTKVNLGGQWVNAPRNPGLFVRNRYGNEIYRHAEHLMFTGGRSRDQTSVYKPDLFLHCTDSYAHNCLDRYNADGDLPFVELLP